MNPSKGRADAKVRRYEAAVEVLDGGLVQQDTRPVVTWLGSVHTTGGSQPRSQMGQPAGDAPTP